jgi:hypothetical protein
VKRAPGKREGRAPTPIADEPRGEARGFVVLSLAVAVGLVCAIGAVNAVVDPYATLGTNVVAPAVWTDRGEKIGLYETLDEPPAIVILGSSRAMKIEPAYLRRQTGRTAFNFAVSDGKAPDAFAVASFAHDRAAGARQDFLWLMDLETFSENAIDPRLLSTEELARYLPAGARLKGRAEDVAWLLSWKTLRESLRALHNEVESRDVTVTAGGERKAPKPEFAADGFRRWDAHDRRTEKGRRFEDALPASVTVYKGTYGDRFSRLSPLAKEYVERTLASANEWGARPVIALSPIHPELRKVLLPLDYEARHREVVAYLGSLKERYDFVFLDMTGLDAFGGSPSAFYDGVHMKVANTRRLLDAIVAGSEGVLTTADGGE